VSIVEWNEDAVMRRALEAARGGIDETLDAAVEVAQERVRKKRRRLMGAIKAKPAQVQGDTVSGTFGVHAEDDPGYAAAQEFLPEDNTPAVGEDGSVPGRKASGRAYVRPAADQEFPKLAGRIAERFR
jgi:hypothetical protein